ncbi:MAG: patatin-like phospholipase family protein, partial [Betaproteobacteria bacterium]
MPEAQRPVRFERVLNEEIDLIARARRAHAVATEPIEPAATDDAQATSRARSANLCGLALSGGGIRSATFNLGIIQALSRNRLLGRCDYISTVSGGGYIGAWLTAWIHRHERGVHGVQREMREALLGTAPEPREIGWLRDYSNYLTLRLGYFSGDSWATVAIYLRNLWLNLTLIVACLGFAMLLPRLLIHALDWIPGVWFGPIGVAFMAVAIASTIVNLDAAPGKFGWFRSQSGVMLTILAPGLIASVLLAHALIVDFPGAWRVREIGLALWPQLEPMHMSSWIIAGALVYTFPWLSGAMASLIVPTPPG